jgi:glycerophosphoryl diester phosphodiesterase
VNQHVAFIQENLGIDMINAVRTAVTGAGYGNQTSLQINVLSTDSVVLIKLRQDTKYKLIYKIGTNFHDASPASVADIRRFADAVAINKESVYPEDRHFITNETNILSSFQSAGLKVYGYGFKNEFVSQPWDFFADATVELNTYFTGAKIDGFITDFPATARRYKSMFKLFFCLCCIPCSCFRLILCPLTSFRGSNLPMCPLPQQNH